MIFVLLGRLFLAGDVEVFPAKGVDKEGMFLHGIVAVAAPVSLLSSYAEETSVFAVFSVSDDDAVRVVMVVVVMVVVVVYIQVQLFADRRFFLVLDVVELLVVKTV